MSGFSNLDYIALALFVGAWLTYYSYVEFSSHGKRSLNVVMHQIRFEWMRRCYERENRIFDAQIMGGLQNGTAFFASSAFLAVGGTLSALGFTDAALEVFQALPFTTPTTRAAFEVKVLGLATIFAYSFFKLVWAYRLFNYVAILMGTMPILGCTDKDAIETSIERASRMNVSAARHFNRGLRAYFFAIAYLGWFAGPYTFILTTAVVSVVLWRRQFTSDSIAAASWTKS